MDGMRTFACLLVLFSLAALSPAPIDRRKDFKGPVPEVSQSTLEAAQGGPIQPETPTAVEPVSEPSAQVQAPAPSSQAEVALARVEQSKAEEALRRASATVDEEAPNPVRFVLIGAVCLALGAGAVAVVRHYADKNVPAPKTRAES